MRFFFYSHDGMGLGHVRRQIAIAAALGTADPDSQVLLATSIDDLAGLGLPPNVDTLKLPALRKIANGDYSGRRLTLPKTQLRRFRSAVLRAAVEGFEPDVVLVDKHPFGAKGELTPALRAAKAKGARLVLGLRDVLDDPATVVREWAQEQIHERLPRYFDLVLVYGDPAVCDPLQHCPLPPGMAGRTHYCGYVVGPAGCASCAGDCPHLYGLESLPHSTVLCTVGGGEDGAALLKAFLGAAAGAGWKSLAVGGPLLSEPEVRELRLVAAQAGVMFQSYLPCLSKLFWRIGALVCMGGYNTLLEAVSKGVPIICVPRTAPRSEQLIRARAFHKLDLLRLLLPTDLTPKRLSQEVAVALQENRADLMSRANAILTFSGAEIASHLLLGLHSRTPRSPQFKPHAAAFLATPPTLAEPA